MKYIFKFITVLIVFSVGLTAIYLSGARLSSKPLPDSKIRVTILYDNYIFTEGTQADWGFSCLIEGTEKTILFDTGTQPEILWHNIGKLNIDIDKIDMIAICCDMHIISIHNIHFNTDQSERYLRNLFGENRLRIFCLGQRGSVQPGFIFIKTCKKLPSGFGQFIFS